ncbi:MAG TPA: general secretion pathway protein GspI, partial [Halieaceae bacterium]|nr:general secretion pathway protein GspI [Halieaceae bacterium]
MDRRKEGGFSLIEMIVAIVILALSLGMLYQAAAGATRNVRIDERYSYA